MAKQIIECTSKADSDLLESRIFTEYRAKVAAMGYEVDSDGFIIPKNAATGLTDYNAQRTERWGAVEAEGKHYIQIPEDADAAKKAEYLSGITYTEVDKVPGEIEEKPAKKVIAK